MNIAGASAADAAIRITNLSKDYKDVRAVDRVSFTVAPGETFGFMGHNGAGKTTTIKMLLGLTPPSGGSASVLGRDVVRDSLDVEPGERLVERRRRLPDVLEAREALETKLAELAAERRTDEDLAAIRAAIDHMEREIEEGAYGVEGDRLFHTAVTAAAHSSILAEFMRSIADQITESRNESLRQPGRPTRSLAQHHAILDAIADRRPRQAATTMRRHVRTVAKVRLLDWGPEGDDDSTA